MPTEQKFRFSPALTLITSALILASCGRRAAPQVGPISDERRSGEAAGRAAFAAVSEKIRPAVVVLATFDEHGGLVANEHGFFISADGDLLAERSAMNNAASAVVKTADGHAYDIFGAYVRSAAPNFILLKTNARNVPHLEAPANATLREGAPAAVVIGTAGGSQTPLLAGTISGHKRDENGEWLDFQPPLPNSAIGAPAIDDKGAFIGIVALPKEEGPPAIFRSIDGKNPLIAQAAPAESTPGETEVATQTSPAPGGGEPEVTLTPPSPTPTRAPSAAAQRLAEIDSRRLQPESSAPTPTKGRFFIRMNPNWRLHAKDRPGDAASATPEPPGAGPKITYSPRPGYSTKGLATATAGSYRITFSAGGRVADVTVTRSAGSSALDESAVATLRKWRSEPGSEWSTVVPINFTP